jgi:hypothetical protein
MPSSEGSTSALPSPSSSAPQRPPNPVEAVRVEQAQDGGAVERVEWVPPQYNPEWELEAAQGRNPTPIQIPGAEPTRNGLSAARQDSKDHLLSPSA